jgi:hypothetical protein
LKDFGIADKAIKKPLISPKSSFYDEKEDSWVQSDPSLQPLFNKEIVKHLRTRLFFRRFTAQALMPILY